MFANTGSAGVLHRLKKIISGIVGVLFLLCFSFTFSELQAQDMNVVKKDGSQISFKIDDIAKLKFNSGNIIIEGKTGSNDTYSLTDIKLITFRQYVSVPYSPLNNSNIKSIYPNPTESSIIVQHISSGKIETNVEIINMMGELIIRRNFISDSGTSDVKVDVSSIPAGVYMCRIIEGDSISSKLFIKY